VTPKQFEQLVRRDLNAMRRRVEGAMRKTARRAKRVIDKNIPIAFGELEDSIHSEEYTGSSHVASTIASAPHAAAVEAGSRPHLVPLEDLIKWVKLRGMQGLTASGRIRTARWKPRGTTTFEHARRVARQLRGMESGGALSIDAPEQIARAIQQAILKNGTRPHWYMSKSLPGIEQMLVENIDAVISKYGPMPPIQIVFRR